MQVPTSSTPAGPVRVALAMKKPSRLSHFHFGDRSVSTRGRKTSSLLHSR